jgi:hypothetical protein
MKSEVVSKDMGARENVAKAQVVLEYSRTCLEIKL